MDGNFHIPEDHTAAWQIHTSHSGLLTLCAELEGNCLNLIQTKIKQRQCHAFTWSKKIPAASVEVAQITTIDPSRNPVSIASTWWTSKTA